MNCVIFLEKIMNCAINYETTVHETGDTVTQEQVAGLLRTPHGARNIVLPNRKMEKVAGKSDKGTIPGTQRENRKISKSKDPKYSNETQSNPNLSWERAR